MVIQAPRGGHRFLLVQGGPKVKEQNKFVLVPIISKTSLLHKEGFPWETGEKSENLLINVMYLSQWEKCLLNIFLKGGCC